MKKIIKIILTSIILLFLFTNQCFAQELTTDVEPTVESEIARDILGAKKKDEPIVESPNEKTRDEETIAVIEIKDQTFEEAFFSLIDASMVNYTSTGNSLTVIKGGVANPIMIFGLGATAVDKSLPIQERRADISYDNQDLATLLKDLANKYGIDVVLTATPTERVSCRVRDVNIEEALKLVLSGTSFDYTTSGDANETYVIYNRLNKNFTVGQETKMFPLMNLEAMDVQALLPVEVRTNVRISNDQNSI